MKHPTNQQYILHHDDFPCKEELDKDGYCPICKLYPDMQSTCLWPNPDYIKNDN